MGGFSDPDYTRDRAIGQLKRRVAELGGRVEALTTQVRQALSALGTEGAATTKESLTVAPGPAPREGEWRIEAATVAQALLDEITFQIPDSRLNDGDTLWIAGGCTPGTAGATFDLSSASEHIALAIAARLSASPSPEALSDGGQREARARLELAKRHMKAAGWWTNARGHKTDAAVWIDQALDVLPPPVEGEG